MTTPPDAPQPSTSGPPIQPTTVAPAADQPDRVAPGPQAVAATVPREAAPVEPAVLDADRRTLLAAALDRLVPPNGVLPGAGGLGVSATIERTLAAAPPLRRLFLDGLVAIDVAAARRGAQRRFSELTADEQDATLREVERELPAFFSALVDHTYRGYYILPQVHAAIGYESRPPQPLGYPVAPFDPELLAKQRRRASLWRRIP